MSVELIVGNETFDYPENGTNPQEQWGESATEWARAVTTVLSSLQSPNDITLTTYPLADNISTPTNIIGLRFSTTAVIHAEVEYVIQRVVDINVGEVASISGNVATILDATSSEDVWAALVGKTVTITDNAGTTTRGAVTVISANFATKELTLSGDLGGTIISTDLVDFATVYVESGKILGNYDGTDFFISTETVGDAGIEISVTSTGQFQYISSNLGHDSCIIRFKGSAIAGA